MPFTRDILLGVLAGAGLLLSGCMQDRPAERDIPWSTPASWEGTLIPLPSSFQNER